MFNSISEAVIPRILAEEGVMIGSPYGMCKYLIAVKVCPRPGGGIPYEKVGDARRTT